MSRKMLIDGELNQSNEQESHYDFDLFVIGAGSGGVRASRFSANYGAKVYYLLSIQPCGYGNRRRKKKGKFMLIFMWVGKSNPH